MPATVENIKLDEDNAEFNYAVEFVKHTDRLVYLTGKAGTGKTTFLKYLKQTTTKNTVIVAPTGVAAINAGGQTIHSLFLIKPGVYFPTDKRLRTSAGFQDTDKSTIYDHFKLSRERIDLLRKMQLLVIDEISMVRCDLLDVVDRLLRVYRRRMFEPFGGVQVILIGDTFQLPPIAAPDEWEILGKFYKSPFFFSAAVMQQYKPVYIELKKIYRQKEQDFIDLLNKVRINQVSQIELAMLNNKYDPNFSPPENANFITLATHNKIVDETNATKLASLPGEVKSFEATITGIFPENILADKVLQLKEGAQIMFIKNDKLKKFHNGKIAKIKSLSDDRIVVETRGADDITVEKEEWQNIRYSWNERERKIEEDVIGTFTQFPIKLAWAVTIHKSQGLTFENVIADIGAAFAPGQVYVALSRCTSLKTLVLKSRIERNAIKTDPEAINFARNETPGTLMIQELNDGKADYYYKKAREAVKADNLPAAYEHFMNAVQFRNDVETETFNRYLSVITRRLQTKSNKLNKALLAYKQRIDELAKAKPAPAKQVTATGHTINKLNEQVKQLTAETKQKTQKLAEAEKTIAALKNTLAQQEYQVRLALQQQEAIGTAKAKKDLPDMA